MDTHLQDRRESESTARFFGLRLKFVCLFSFILVMACSSLSWYFIETRRQAMTDNLEELGNILLINTVRNDHFRIAGVVLEDRSTLDQFIQSLMTIDHVVYVTITSADGRILERQSKRMRRTLNGSSLTTEQPLYPDDRISESLLQTPLTAPLMTKLVLSAEQTLVPQDQFADWLLPFLMRKETLFDFAMPVLREPSSETAPSRLSVELEEKQGSMTPIPFSPVLGLVRIGITDAQSKQALLAIVQNVSILTMVIIALGILGAHLLTSRITTPLRSLAHSARQLAGGNDAPVRLTASTNDEVGELTHVFNVMIQSLHDRNNAITMNLDTIRKQIKQLTTVHQASTAIANANMFDMNQLLDSVLHLLVENLGFSRMVVFLHHPERNCASIAQSLGFAPEVQEASHRLDIPVVSDSITAELIIHGKPVLIRDVETIAHRMYPPVLDLMRHSGVRSFVAVPLQSHARILGYLGGDRGAHQCTEEDLHILLTIAGHVAAAIDNAKAYSELTELTQHLEERIAQRTAELSLANLQLQAHDTRRSKYVKVVSHELRTPMTAIWSFVENMLDGVTGPLTEQQRIYLTRIKHSVARLARLAEELLDWLRSDHLRLQHVCIGQIATIVAEGLETVASDSRVSLAVAPIENLPLVQGDPDKLEQILVNLIGNAIKFTPSGGRVTVEFTVGSSGFVQTCVADTGCGIDSSHLPYVFDEFSEVPSAMPASQGAQLGLYITKTLVARHHGRIWVESQPEAGSRFSFTLPIAGPLNETGQTT
ncbi:MAG: GAF domain-containing protein [Nitrospira sp.]|nr:GAF domain-containing protein [Nitrospira sp.]